MDYRETHDALLNDYIKLSNATITSFKDEQFISSLFYQMCPMTRWGKVNWEYFTQKTEPTFDYEDMVAHLTVLLGEKFDRSVYATYDSNLPMIKTTLENVVQHADDFHAISFTKFIFNLDDNYVVEIKNSGEIITGIAPINHKFLQINKYVDPYILKSNSLFRTCVEMLNIDLLPLVEEKMLSDWFTAHAPMSKWGRIYWRDFEGYANECSYSTIKRGINELFDTKGVFDKTAYIAWSGIGIPIIKTNLDDIIGKFDVIDAVCSDKYIFNPEMGYIVEVSPGGHEAIIGRIANKE